jgi:hypothetical protein
VLVVVAIVDPATLTGAFTSFEQLTKKLQHIVTKKLQVIIFFIVVKFKKLQKASNRTQIF